MSPKNYFSSAQALPEPQTQGPMKLSTQMFQAGFSSNVHQLSEVWKIQD